MIKKIFDLSDDERQLFRDAISDVKAYSHDTEKTVFRNTSTKNETEKISFKKIALRAHAIEPTDVGSEDRIGFAKTGLQHKAFSRLKQGKMRVEATLDLHEHTCEEAIIALERFFTYCQHQGFRSVFVIHGKGHHSANNKPILKNFLNAYLRTHSHVLAFHSAKNKHGGAGAVMILLKK